MTLQNQVYDENLKLFYAAIDKNYDDRTTTKKWCLTVWLALIAFLGKEGQSLEFLTAISLSYAPIALFWFLEAIQGGYAKILIDKALEMEQLLLSGWNGIESPEQYLYMSGRQASVWEKVRATLYAAFAMETVLAFYIILAAASYLLISLMRG